MILNILVCVFLLGMVVLWSTYGFFSAFLNLLVTIASGLLAFALWEPVAHWMLGMGWISAWGIGLLVPYAVVFIGLRLAVLAVVRKNLGFHPVADQVGGGALGLAAGVLTAGMLVIGAGMMADDKTLLNVQRFRLNEDGSVGEDKKDGVSLWVPVDRLTGNLFEYLSAGGFRPSGGTPLAAAYPSLADIAEKRRLAEDPMATRTAAPGDGVKVTGVYAMDFSPEAVEALLRRGAAYAVMKKESVDEVWKGADQKQVESRMADLVAEAVGKGDVEKTLFDGKYLGNADRKGVRGLLARPVNELPESVLRRMWAYAVDQVPGGASSVKGDKAPEPTRKLFTRFSGNDRLIIVDTAWDKEKSKAYDEGVLRLSPHQIKLAAVPGRGVAGARYQPLAWSTDMTATPAGFARRELIELAAGKIGMYGTLAQPGTPDHLAFVFAVPKGVEIASVEMRGLRFPLTKMQAVVPGGAGFPEMAQLVGHVLPPGDPEAKPENVVGATTAPAAATVTEAKVPLGILDFSCRLPLVLDWTSPDEQHSKYREEKRETVLIAGEFEREPGRGLGTSSHKLTKLQVPTGARALRLLLTLDQCHTLWGAMLDSSERGSQELVVRTDGRQIAPAGFILVRETQNSVVRIDANGGFKVTGKVLADLRPVMGANDRLYVYFFVDESETLAGYGLLDAASAKLNAAQQYDLAKPLDMKQVPPTQ